eukprot:Hpha_TRINITY_DN1014_c0_g1::TRINITY_DN1014_c0_g1_i1::g.84797::m.84797
MAPNFSVAVAGEVRGGKHNYELSFPGPPSLAQLLGEAEAVLSRASQSRYSIRSAQVYSAGESGWRDLNSSDQISHRCQVYVFPQISATAARQVFSALAQRSSRGMYLDEWLGGVQAARVG